MRDIVIITSYNRPDYLRLCLDYLSRAAGIENKEIRICIDRGRSLLREFYEVINDFRPALNISTVIRPEHSYHGNSFNTLEAYKEAHASAAEFVYLVEDDVLVQPDFFTWHEAVQGLCDCLCSIAYRCNRNSEARRDISDPTAYFVTARDFASVGVCWRRERLEPVIQHARPEYYADLGNYINRTFPNNRFGDCFTEQDGLIMRVMGVTNAFTVWPYVPRCYHVGFAGYNRPRGPRLSYAELQETVHKVEKVRAADRDFGDIEPVPTEPVEAWDASKLHCVQRFN